MKDKGHAQSVLQLSAEGYTTMELQGNIIKLGSGILNL